MRSRNSFFEFCLILFVGIAAASAVIRVSGMEPKWFKVLIIGALGSAFLSILLPRHEKIFLLTLAFLLPLTICTDLYKESVPYERSINALKISAFDLLFFPLLLEWLYRIVTDYRVRVSLFPHITIPFFLIVMLCIAGLYPVEHTLIIKITSIWKLLRCWLITIYVANNLDTPGKIYIVIGMVLLSGMFQGAIGTGQYVKGAPLGLTFLGEKTSFWGAQEGVNRIGGTIGHPNKFALFLGVLLQVNISSFFARFPKNSKWYLRLTYLLPFAPMLFALLVSFSRSGWASFLIGGVINCSWCMGKRTGKKILSFLLVSGFFVCFAILIFLTVESVRNRLLMDDKGAAEVRHPLAQVAWNIIEDKPWLGIGLNNYCSGYPEYDDTEFAVSIVFPLMVHNEFLLIAAETGIPAFLCFIYILCWLFFTLWRISRIEYSPVIPYLAIGFFSGFTGWCIHNQKEFAYVLFSTRTWFYIGIILSMKFFLEKEIKERFVVARQHLPVESCLISFQVTR
nr:O-antigen ligase family protein [Candidatus Electrothrix aestuarii]